MAEKDEGELVLKVEFEAKMQISAIVDLVEHFVRMPEVQRPHYWGFDIKSAGFDDEYERPLAWLVDALEDDVRGFGAGTMRGGSSGFNDGEIDDWDITVKRKPNGVFRTNWTEADFDALAAAVPWLRPPEPPEAISSTSRKPGPMDQPLFDLET